MKKILKLSLLIAIVLCIVVNGNVYAVTCNMGIQGVSEHTKGEEFTLDVVISNITSERGVISLTATLDYDKDSLSLVKMEGKNNWATPIEGASYNPTSGSIAIERNGLGKNDETIFTLTFKVKDTAKANTSVALKNVAIADGDEMAKFNSVEKAITIKEASITTPSTGNTGNDSENGSTQGTTTGEGSQGSTGTGTNNGAGNSTNTGAGTNNGAVTNVPSSANQAVADKTVNQNKIPQTGQNDIIFAVAGVIAIILTTYFAVRMKITSKI